MIKNNYKGFAENLLFALNIFIIFLLLFNNYLVVPVWLQPVGRLHPLLLHFPIVVLMIAMTLEFFRFRERFVNEKLYHDFTTLLWLSGTLLAAFTAIMGIFLSKEPGYDGEAIQWHKWFGVLVVFISSIIFWLRNAQWYTPVIARAGSLGALVCLLLAGHLGADITHGDNFILAPVWHPEKEKVPVEKALVYKDVVQPIFQDKCVSCHNPGKAKGGLALMDEKAILKGGKDGRLFIAGQPQISLLLQRIHLPEQEKKHMPPAGKPQLTADEEKLLYLWVKGNADFKQKVISLPAADSLRVLAATFLKPAEEKVETYDFAPADAAVVKKLNNNYRVIYALAQESPALGVNIYNKSVYQPKVLEELSEIKKQVVSLDVSKMPVKDAELKTIAKFENLRTLILNFTDITGTTIKDLASLKYLRTLSLAGTKLNAKEATQISSLKSLNEIALWDSGLSDAEIAKLEQNNKNITFIKGFKDDGKPVKLNAPQLKNTALVFTKPFPLLMAHPIKGVQIRYTTDGTDPDSIKAKIYTPGAMIAENTAIKAKAYKSGWLGSDIVQFAFYKSTYKPDSINFITVPDTKYSGDGPKTLIDRELGGTSFGNGKWIASQKDLAIFMQFKTAVPLHTVTLNCMRNTGSQIFLPVAVEVWGGTDAGHLKMLSRIITSKPLKDDPFLLKGMECKLEGEKSVSCLKIIARPLQTLPVWDPVKNQQGWVFIDEVFLN